MSGLQPKVLVVDDNAGAGDSVRTVLHDVGLSCEVLHLAPREPEKPFGGVEFPSSKILDGLDYALLDVELFPDFVDVGAYNGRDMRGATEFLPRLRREAPWLPVIGYSIHFTEPDPHFFPYATAEGFDAEMPRTALGKGVMNRSGWVRLIDAAKRHRFCSSIGSENVPAAGFEYPDILVADRLDSELREFAQSWKALVEKMFFFASEVSVSPMNNGFSGAQLLRCGVTYRGYGTGDHSEWVVKLSSRPTKLWREARAHLEAVRSGMPHGTAVHLLWRTPLVESGVAAIAYQFAVGASPASTLVGEWTNDRGVFARLARCLASVHGECVRRKTPLVVSVDRWLPVKSRLELVRQELGATAWADWITEVLDGGQGVASTISVTYGLVHGDLHLDNILISSRGDVVIDFALAGPGPTAVDVAKLLVDCAIRDPDLRSASWISSSQAPDSAPRWIQEWLQSAGGLPGDAVILDLMSRMYLAVALTYDDTTEEVRSWIRALAQSDRWSLEAAIEASDS